MDRKSIIGYVLIFFIFVGYIFINNKNMEEAREQQRIEDSIATANSRTDTIIDGALEIRPSSDETLVEANESDSGEEVEAVLEKPAKAETFHSIANEQMSVKISSKGGRIAEVELADYKRYDSTGLVLFDASSSSFNYTIPLRSGVVRTQDLDFEAVEQSADHIVMEHKLPGGGALRQHYDFEEGYLMNYRFEMDGLKDKIARKNNEFSLDWIVQLPQQEKSIKDERDYSTVYYKYKNEDDIDYLSERQDDDEELQANIQWINFKQKFFSSILISKDGLEESGTSIEVRQPESDEYVEYMEANISLPYDFEEKESEEFQFYFGPNHYQTLKKMDMSMEKVVPLGWGIIGWVNKFAVIPVFNWLDNYFVSYGLIILLLTLMIKFVLIFPMYKIYISSAKMKLLKPELDELKEKVGGDMTKMQQEQMKLYKTAGVSPFGGCLPQLVQFPILIAMFRFFPASIELRQQAFLWAEDLSSYDSILSLGFEIPFYGSHVSLFTLLMAGSTLLYTMFNAQTTAATGQMKYIMYLMPIMLLVWFNSYASGLSYYYFLANMITFGQNMIFRKFIVDEDKLHKQIQDNKKKKVKGKKPSKFQKRLEEMAKKRGIDPKQMKR